MEKKEMLILAAKAAGLQLRMDCPFPLNFQCRVLDGWVPWDPSSKLASTESMELAQQLGMTVDFACRTVRRGDIVICWPDDEPYAQRAITRVAAEIGRSMHG